MKNRSIKISQKDNYEANFGYVYRSSAIFYYLQNKNFKTTISLMDYWTVKRGLDVMIIFSLRNMEGKLKDRRSINFEKGKVINYNEFIGSEFEGSVEVEVFASKNMVIPYSAIMAIYEHENSISMCHSYGRIYSPHEVEENRTITIGEESCWTIRDDKEIKSFCIFHNGHGVQKEQKIKLEVTNHKNKKLQFEANLKTLEPYTTVKLIPQKIMGSQLIDFLEGKPGNLAISYNLNTSFTRMLVGNETDTEFQITHSNFNYSKHKTDNAGKGEGFMHFPEAGFKEYELIVYPDCSPGNYTIEKDNIIVSRFSTGERSSFPVSDGFIKIYEEKGTLPSRIVTALTAKPAKDNSKLPYECSLGIIHKLRPMKSTFWGLVSIEEDLESRIFIVPMDSIYGKSSDTSLRIKIYTEDSQEPFERTLNKEELTNAQKGLYVSTLFPQLKKMKGGRFAWFYFRSESYGGFQTYSTIESEKGSLTLEHSF